MWPYMGQIGWWMGGWWFLGIALLILIVAIISRTAGGFAPRAEDAPEAILKRRYARGEVEREEYQRRLEDLRR
jgi:putative membrane protein